jgi:glyoxylase-like metal-dependent hydrolase (beta-lactamase superfamily II)
MPHSFKSRSFAIRVVASAAFAALLSVAFWAPRSSAQGSRLQEVAPGVWFRLGERDQGHCNNTIIEMEDYLIVIDANFPSGAELAMTDIKSVSSKPVKYVFDTHHHGDHLYGNPVWTKAGATTLAYHTVLQEIARYEPQGWQSAAANRPDVAALGLATAEPPMQVFTQIPHVIQDATRRVEFHFFGWAHTRGDGFAYLPNEGVLVTGDAIVNGPFNFMGHGNVGNWPNVIERAKGLRFDKVLPGHGPMGGREVPDGQQAFMREIHAAVSGAIGQGQSLADIVKMTDGAPTATSLQLSAAVQNWVGPSFPQQVMLTYEEISEGKPHGEIVGGK